MNAKDEERARFRQAVLDMRDVVRHGNHQLLNKHTDDALMFGDAYAAAAVAEAVAPLVEALRAVEWPEIQYRTAIIGRLCPSCGNWKGDDPDYNYHAADCQLAAAALAAKETP